MCQISVVVATHNRSKLLRLAIQSILFQSLQDFEIIIVDDASQDDTPSVIAALCRSDPRIRSVRSEQNIGPGAARNLGIQQARGEFIAIMDDDDFSLPHRFEVQTAALRSHPEVSLVYSSVRWVDGLGNEIGGAYRGEMPQEPDEILKLLYLESNKIPNTTVMARRSLLLANPYPSEPWVGEDWLLMMQLAASGVWFLVEPQHLVNVLREANHSSLVRNTTCVHQAQRKVLRLMRAWLKEKGIRKFDGLHARANSNQAVREARCYPGFRGLFMAIRAMALDPTNGYAWGTLKWFFHKAISKIVR